MDNYKLMTESRFIISTSLFHTKLHSGNLMMELVRICSLQIVAHFHLIHFGHSKGRFISISHFLKRKEKKKRQIKRL